MTSRPLTVILAEDDDGHATLIRRNLQRYKTGVEIVRLRNGREVLEYFGGTDWRGRAAVLLLDIRMPDGDGTEVLRVLKSKAETRMLPVYMLTTTDDSREIDRCFAFGCNAYITKPINYAEFVAAMQRLCEFMEVSQFPGVPGQSHNASA